MTDIFFLPFWFVYICERKIKLFNKFKYKPSYKKKRKTILAASGFGMLPKKTSPLIRVKNFSLFEDKARV